MPAPRGHPEIAAAQINLGGFLTERSPTRVLALVASAWRNNERKSNRFALPETANLLTQVR